MDVKVLRYASMDRLLARQDAIEKHLSARHRTSATLVLYNITMAAFPGGSPGEKIPINFLTQSNFPATLGPP